MSNASGEVDLMGNPLASPIVDLDESSSEVQVEVVDDRPVEDQVSDRDSDAAYDGGSDEDAVQGGRAQKRIKQLRYEYHEERRQKEAAERLREEAVNYAQQVANQNNEMRQLLARGETVLLSEIKARSEADAARARSQYQDAYEAGDADKIAQAQERIAKVQYDRSKADEYQPMGERLLPQGPQPQPQRQVQQQVPPDPKVQDWVGKNSWFGQDEEMTSFAYGLHEKLVQKEGIDPRSDEYYNRIDQRMREVFPAKFAGETGTVGPAANQRTSTVVAPAQRAGGMPRKVQLTSTQVALAKRLGITPEQYAKQLLKDV